MSARSSSLKARSLLELPLVLTFALFLAPSLATAGVDVTFFTTYPASAPDPNLSFPGGSVLCSATDVGTDSGFNFNFGDSATRSLLCPSNPNAISNASSFGARFTGTLNVAAAGTYHLTLNTDDGDVLTINGTTVDSVWAAKGGGPGPLSVPLLPGANPFVLDYFQSACCGAFVQLSAGTGVTIAPPSAAVPEPTSLALFVLGLAVAGFVRGRDRRTLPGLRAAVHSAPGRPFPCGT